MSLRQKLSFDTGLLMLQKPPTDHPWPLYAAVIMNMMQKCDMMS
jgi:hypothetical protein